MAIRSINYTTTIEQWHDQYNLLAGDIGNLTQLDTVVKTSMVDVANELEANHNSLDAWIGARSISHVGGIITPSSVVDAIEDIWQDYYDFLGRGVTFTTVASNVVAAINELETNHNALDTRVGPLATLNNDIEGADIVASMNLLDVKFEDWTGFGTTLNTAADDLAAAVNEIHDEFDSLNSFVGLPRTFGFSGGLIAPTTVLGALDDIWEDYYAFAGRGLTFSTTATTLLGAINEIEGNHNALDTRVGPLTSIASAIRGSNIALSIDSFYDDYIVWAAPAVAFDTTADTASGAVNELHSEHDALDSRVGALATLNNDIEGASIVLSINLLDVKFENFAGFGTALGTAANDLAGAVNELHGEINANDTDINNIRNALTGSSSSVSLTGINDAIEGASIVATLNNFYTAYAARTDVGTALNTTASTLGNAVNELHGPTGTVVVADRDNVDLQSINFRVGLLADLDAGISGSNNDSLVDAINFVYNLQTGETVNFANANLTGNLDVGGTGTFDGHLQAQGLFTSRGIDDNATANRLQIENSATTIKNNTTVQGTLNTTGALSTTNLIVGTTSSVSNNTGERVEFDADSITLVASATSIADFASAGITLYRAVSLANNNINLTGTGTLNIAGSEIFHPGNMGSGSGLDADLLDGVQLSNIARTDIAEIFTNDVTIQGNLTVTGTTTTINTENLNVADNFIGLNTDVTGTPTENAGIIVERGTSANVLLRWNETSDYWDLTRNGSVYYQIYTAEDNGTFDAATLDGQNSAYYRNAGNINAGTLNNARLPASQTGKTFTSDTIFNTAIQTDLIKARTGNEIAVTAGESHNQVSNLPATTEAVYLIGEAGVRIVSSSNNWGTDAWTNRYEATLVDTTGASVFPGNVDATGLSVSGSAVWHAGNFTPTAQPASNITSGTFAAARIPDLAASKITSGTFAAARMADSLVPASSDEIASGVNLNNMKTAGFYHQTSNADAAAGTNWPVPLAGSLVVQKSGGTGGVTQQFYQYNNDGVNGTPEFYFRAYSGVSSGDAWSAWARVWTDENHGAGSGMDSDLLDGQHGSYYRNAGNINAGTLASARLPDLTVADFAGAAIQVSSESFSDSNTVLMTAAAIEDRILSKGYTSNVGDITGVTAGTGLTGGGTSGSVTLNVANLTVNEIDAGSLQLSSESFVDSNSILMTAAAIEDRILSKGYTSNVGDITGVTAGTGLTGGGTSGSVTLNVSGLTTAQFAGAALQTGSEAWADSDTVLMTAAAINDLILAKGYTSNTGDITGVTAGGGMTGGGTSGSVTISHANTSSQGSVSNTGGSVITGLTLDTYGHLTGITSTNLDSRYLLSGGTAANSQLLDSLDSTQFLRSDANDIKTAGYLRFNDSVELELGTGGDFEMFHNGSHAYFDMVTGNLYIRDGSTTRFTFDDNGEFTATGDITAFSDVTLKRLMRPLENPLANIKRLSGMSYEWNDKAAAKGLTNEGRQIGLIAQEVEAVYPELVVEDEDGIKKVKYEKMVPVLLEAIKELAAKVERLENAAS